MFNNRLSLPSTEFGAAENERFGLGMAVCWRNGSSCYPGFITDLLQRQLQLLAAATAWANCLSLRCKALAAVETNKQIKTLFSFLTCTFIENAVQLSQYTRGRKCPLLHPQLLGALKSKKEAYQLCKDGPIAVEDYQNFARAYRGAVRS